MKKRKHYNRRKHHRTGRRVSAHRYVMELALGRPLLAGEVVHHRDGNVRNNSRENLVVLPDQATHAHLEAVLRKEKLGQPCLLPELRGVTEGEEGSLFENIGSLAIEKQT